MTMKISAIQKTSTPELVVQELLKNIKNGELNPGDKLPPERNLAESFGVSRSSVREAISAMVLVGYLEVTQGKGIFLKKDIPSPYIYSTSLRDVLDAYWILDMIETRHIMEYSVVRLAVKRADTNDVNRLRKIISRMEENIDNMEGFYQADFDFHNTICEAAGNEVISEMVRTIIAKTHDQYIKFMPDSLCEPEQAISTAKRLVESIENQNMEQACKEMIQHLNIVPSELSRIFPEVKNYRNQIESIFCSTPSQREAEE